MTPPLSLGFSPCPNDTFVFHALVHGLVDTGGLRFAPRLEDVETLNGCARAGALDITKVSYGVLPFLHDYVPLRAGGALGRGCGPLVVARTPIPMDTLRGRRIAIPGRDTTANLLLRLFDSHLSNGVPIVYSEIMPAVARGAFDAGLIIHESRFTYHEHGLVALVDLGAWWEETTGLPIPLGAIVAHRRLGSETIRQIDQVIAASVRYAFAEPDASRDYVRAHAQEMDDAAIRAHIALYVNDFTVDIGDEGARAVAELTCRACALQEQAA